MKKVIHRKLMAVWATLATLALTLAASPAYADESDLDAAISAGFGKLVKYGRWTATLALAVVFCLAWAERGQNSDNPHEQNRASRKMLWSGIGFVAVIGYKLVLTGFVRWFNIDAAAIPSFLWQ